MGNETKSNGASSLGVGGGGFRAKMEHYVYSGEKKHVLAGIGIITIIFGIPWYLMNQEIKVVLMGTIDLRAAADEISIADLSSQVHQLPCCIRFDGHAQVSHYFKPKSSEVEIDGVRTEEAYFRGRKLQGATISLPSGYSGTKSLLSYL